jgi:HK97 family phage prohead protease
MTTRRSLGGEVRAAISEDGKHFVTLQAVKSGVVDDFGSLWNANAFDETLAQRLPTLVWAHDWSDPIGHGVSFTPGPDGPMVRAVFDNFDAVPRARQAFAQTESGTIRDCSVGFSEVTRREPTPEELKAFPGVREVIERATMDELSLVLAGAVPGAKVLSVRMANDDALVSREDVGRIMARLATGELSLTQALNEVAGLPESDADEPIAEDDEDPDDETNEDEDPEPEPDPELEAEADALMADITEALSLAQH